MPICRKVSDLALGVSKVVPDSPSSEAMAAAKIARTEVLNFSDISLEKVQFKDIGKTKSGTPCVVVLHDGFGASCNLTPSGWLSTKFGFDVNCKFGKPSFLGGTVPENVQSEGLAMRIVLNDETTAFLKEIDEKASEEYKQLCKAEWQPLLSEDPVFKTNASVKIHVGLSGKDLTKLTVVHNEKIDRGEGWDFLKGYMNSCNNFRNAEVKVCLRFKKIWHVAGKAGLKLVATRIVLRAIAAPEEIDPFADDAELLV